MVRRVIGGRYLGGADYAGGGAGEGDAANCGSLGAWIRKAERVNVDNGHVMGTVTALARSEMHDPWTGQKRSVKQR
jgi:hypothetical protein